MSTSGDVAEEVMRISMDGVEMSARLAGAGTKEIIAMIYAMLKDQQENEVGKTKLKHLLKSGKELKIFQIQERYLPKFEVEAKRYGVTFCPLKDKTNNNKLGIVDLIVKSDDASRINRIVERYRLQLEMNKLREETEKEKEIEYEEQKNEEKEKKEDVKEVKEEMQEYTSEVTHAKKEFKEKEGDVQNFMKESPLLESSLMNKGELDGKKSSVIRELLKIKKETEVVKGPIKEHVKVKTK